jgi:hypothetical protein
MVAAVLLKLAKIARVGLHRIVAQAALDSQAVEMALDDEVPILVTVLIPAPRRSGGIRARRRFWAEPGFHAAPF